MTTLKMKPIDVIRKANRSEKIEEKFEIVVSGQPIKMSISMPDVFTIMRDQERAYQKEYAICVLEGMDQMDINEAQWEKGLSEITDEDAKKALIDSKPETLAEQTAQKNARLATIQTLIPRILRDPETGNLICTNRSDQEELGNYLSNNSEAMRIITEKWASIMNKYAETRQAVKNSKPDMDIQSSVSNANSQNGDTKGHSTNAC